MNKSIININGIQYKEIINDANCETCIFEKYAYKVCDNMHDNCTEYMPIVYECADCSHMKKSCHATLEDPAEYDCELNLDPEGCENFCQI